MSITYDMGNCGLVLDRKYGSLALASVPRVTGQPSCITDYDQEKFHYVTWPCFMLFVTFLFAKSM